MLDWLDDGRDLLCPYMGEFNIEPIPPISAMESMPSSSSSLSSVPVDIELVAGGEHEFLSGQPEAVNVPGN